MAYFASCLFSHHLVARVYESKAEFRSALQHEKEGYTIYKNQVGPAGVDTLVIVTSTKTNILIQYPPSLPDGRGPRKNQGELRVPEVSDPAGCSSSENHERDLQEWLQRQHHATQGECSDSDTFSLWLEKMCITQGRMSPFFQFTAPSMASILEQLNIINGIIFIPLSAQKKNKRVEAEETRRSTQFTSTSQDHVFGAGNLTPCRVVLTSESAEEIH
ncbi:hypothetical protein GOODEAATRI_002814 [Goodea atripinnis]|uniref:Uncharacterized protein n=1 Tax=Goodea atripinnis TaxID=208336 RepID=A0ABV0MY73_9TELE